MAQKTLNPSEEVAIAGVIDPDNAAAATYTTGWVSMADFQAIMAVIALGAMTASSTVDAKLEQAQDAAGTGAKDVTGSAITQLTQAGGDDDKQVAIECYGEDLDIANEFSHVRLSVTVAAAASYFGAVILGMHARYAPASNYDLASVAEIVTVE